MGCVHDNTYPLCPCKLRHTKLPFLPGDLCSVTVLGQPIIIISNAKVAADMLDRKSSMYSDRPILQMAGDLVGWKHCVCLLPLGDRFRRHRRYFHRLIGSNSTMKQFQPMQELETRRFLHRLLNEPDDLYSHIRRYVVHASILRSTPSFIHLD
jgi:hypothetical protein